MVDSSGNPTTDPDRAVAAEIHRVLKDGRTERHYLQKSEG